MTNAAIGKIQIKKLLSGCVGTHNSNAISARKKTQIKESADSIRTNNSNTITNIIEITIQKWFPGFMRDSPGHCTYFRFHAEISYS